MDELPRLAIAMVTYKRTDEALRTIRGVSENLVYPNELIGWFVGDDGSEKAHSNALILEIARTSHGRLMNYHNERFTPMTGRGWNRVLGLGYQYSDFVLWLEDDWELTKPFFIEPYIRMLMEREDVGLVRLGHLAVGSDVHIVGHNGVHYLKYLKSTQYAYSGNPQIRHARYVKHYGWYATDKNPGEIELDYDARFREFPGGPEIWRPADIPGWGVFGHIGTEKSYE